MSFRIAISKPHPQRPFARTQKLPINVARSAVITQSRQTQPQVTIQATATESKTDTTPWIDHLRTHTDLQHIQAYGQLMRTICVHVSQNSQGLEFRMQALVVASTMAAFFPFASLVMLVDSSARLLREVKHPKLCQFGLYSGTLVVLLIFPATLLFTSTLAGLILILKEELRTLPAELQERYVTISTITQRIALEEKCALWTEELYTELVSPSTPGDNQPVIPEADIELGKSTFVNVSTPCLSTANPSHNSNPSPSLPISVTTDSKMPHSETISSPGSTPSDNTRLPSQFEPITFPKVVIQPHPDPPRSFDAEGWLIVPSPFVDLNQYKNEQTVVTGHRNIEAET